MTDSADMLKPFTDLIALFDIYGFWAIGGILALILIWNAFFEWIAKSAQIK